MLELIVKLVAGLLLSVLGFYVVGKLLENKQRITNPRNIMLLSILTFIPAILYKVEYEYSYTLITCLLAIIVYQVIFKQSIYKVIISTAILMILVLTGDMIVTIFLILFIEGTTSRACWYISLLANVLVDSLVFLFISIPKFQKFLLKFVKEISKSKFMPVLFYLSAIIILISIFGMNFNMAYNKSFSFVVTSIIICLMLLVAYIFIKEKNNYERLVNEYENLHKYVQVFENWIENEQLTRHEYKNQLAVIRAMTKEKKVKDKIDSLIKTTINLNEDVVESLRYIPSGGLKGLLYYKLAIAADHKISTTIDVSKKVEKKLKKLKEDQIKDISKLIGIYFDNAIEGTSGLRKKQITLEIYEIDNKVNFVISNTFNKKSIIKNNNEKGISSKGLNRGNGLYFAKKIIDKSKYLNQQQAIINNFYIQKIILNISK